ncbi:MAG: acyl-CoA dehydrogenase [Bdellovibrio sp.]|nr:acyl-CoA dehydrogenase [Bdellovibrio sp.]
MAQYRTDMRDIHFNLFEAIRVHETGAAGEDDLKDILNEYDKFVGNEIFPTRSISDKEGVKLVNGKVVVPACFLPVKQKFYENGWFGLGMPEEIGGMPAPNAIHLATSSLAAGANVAFDMFTGLAHAALNVILAVGSEEQKALYCEKIMTGEWGGTMCLTEAGAGSDVGAVATVATALGNDKYKIKGTKIFISAGESELYNNNIHLVLARTPSAPKGTKGLSLFIVPRFKINPDGSLGGSNNVVCTKVEEKMGLHGSPTCELNFGLTGDCVGELIGKECDGMANMFIMMNEARLMCGMQGEAQANLAYMLTLQYAHERTQFGTELCKMPDVKRMLLRMRSLSRGMRSLILYTANLFDFAHNGQEDAEQELALLTPICKAWCSEEAYNVAAEAIQIHGGYGYCSEYGIEQFARDSKIATIYEGTNGIQAMDFVTRKILKDKGVTFKKVGEKIMAQLVGSNAKWWPTECAQIGKNLALAGKILEKLGQFAAQNKIDQILEHTYNFLMFSGNLVVAWKLLEHAGLAQTRLTDASSDDKLYYLSKVQDFRFFCQSQLSKNEGLFYAMFNSDFSVTSVEF